MDQLHLNLEIKLAQPDDIEPLVNYFLQVERQHEKYWPLRWALRPDIQDRYTRWITNNRENPDWLFVVARKKMASGDDISSASSGEVLGGLSASIIQEIPIYLFSHYAFIHDLAVRPDARRRGIGRALMQYARQWAKEKGVHQLRLMAAKENTPAEALFTQCGFRGTYTEMVLPV